MDNQKGFKKEYKKFKEKYRQFAKDDNLNSLLIPKSKKDEFVADSIKLIKTMFDSKYNVRKDSVGNRFAFKVSLYTKDKNKFFVRIGRLKGRNINGALTLDNNYTVYKIKRNVNANKSRTLIKHSMSKKGDLVEVVDSVKLSKLKKTIENI